MRLLVAGIAAGAMAGALPACPLCGGPCDPPRVRPITGAYTRLALVHRSIDEADVAPPRLDSDGGSADSGIGDGGAADDGGAAGADGGADGGEDDVDAGGDGDPTADAGLGADGGNLTPRHDPIDPLLCRVPARYRLDATTSEVVERYEWLGRSYLIRYSVIAVSRGGLLHGRF